MEKEKEESIFDILENIAFHASAILEKPKSNLRDGLEMVYVVHEEEGK